MPQLKLERSHSPFSEKSLISILAILFVVTATLTALLVIYWASGEFGTRQAPAPAAVIPVSGGTQPLTAAAPTPNAAFSPTSPGDLATKTVLSPAGTAAVAASGATATHSPTSTSRPTLSPSATPTLALPTPLPWDGSQRVTVLVLGIDQRDWSTESDIPRSDAIILLTIDPARKTASMLSIPRDLYVPIPGMGEYKINTAYRWGELYDLPGGGPGTTMRTVQKVFGVPVDYYVLFDFNAFVKFIDHMGGLDMHIREEIVVDPIGSGNTATMEPGVQTLSGSVALAYARNRYTAMDDFDRSNRQQEVILAIREQVLTFNMLPGLVLKAPQLARDLSNGIETNLTVDQIIRLAWTARQVSGENIRRSVFDPRKDFIYETIETREGKQAILRLKPGRIEALRKELFGP